MFKKFIDVWGARVHQIHHFDSITLTLSYQSAKGCRGISPGFSDEINGTNKGYT
jgi:hypothetical protein